MSDVNQIPRAGRVRALPIFIVAIMIVLFSVMMTYALWNRRASAMQGSAAAEGGPASSELVSNRVYALMHGHEPFEELPAASVASFTEPVAAPQHAVYVERPVIAAGDVGMHEQKPGFADSLAEYVANYEKPLEAAKELLPEIPDPEEQLQQDFRLYQKRAYLASMRSPSSVSGMGNANPLLKGGVYGAGGSSGQTGSAQDASAARDGSDALSSPLGGYAALGQSQSMHHAVVDTVKNPYLIRQGSVIPCVLLTGINSDLPGLVQAEVSQDVYDTASGRYVLIPAGSRVTGQYAPSPALGQRRLMLAFNRVIYPDGRAFDLGVQVGSSTDGYAGLDADVDTHFWSLMGNAVLLGGITAGVSLATDDGVRDDDGNLTLNGALSQGLGQSLGRVMTQVIERNMVISPTLKAEPGLVFNITMVRDIDFVEPYIRQGR